jgi:integrase
MGGDTNKMAIYKRGGGIWWYAFWHKGKRVQQSTRQSGRVLARQLEAAHRLRLVKADAGIEEPTLSPRLDDFALEFLRLVEAERKPRTRRRYCVSLVSLNEAFGSKRLSEITPQEIDRYKQKRLDAGRKGSTINRDLACLRRLLRVAVKRNKLRTSPFSEGRVDFLPEQGRERILSFLEERKYFNAANPTLRDVATLILECGCRPDEVFRINVEDVDLMGHTLRIQSGKTKNARRTVPLTQPAVDVLKRRISAAQGPYLFPFRLGHFGKEEAFDWNRPMTQLWNAHARALATSKIRPAFTLYDCRHTYGTRAIESGVDPLTLMRLMGHANLATTNRYVHLSQSHLADAQKRIEAYRHERAFAEAEEQVPVTKQTM